MMKDQGWKRSVARRPVSDRAEFDRRAIDRDRHGAWLLRCGAGQVIERGGVDPSFSTPQGGQHQSDRLTHRRLVAQHPAHQHPPTGISPSASWPRATIKTPVHGRAAERYPTSTSLYVAPPLTVRTPWAGPAGASVVADRQDVAAALLRNQPTLRGDRPCSCSHYRMNILDHSGQGQPI